MGVYICACTHSMCVWSIIKPSAVECWWKSECESIMYENFGLTVSLLGVISGVYCECRLTCHCVWRCVTVLEYILVWRESVRGCINVCRAPPAYLQAELANRRIRAAEWNCTLQDANRVCSSRSLSDWLAGCCRALQLHACVPLLLGAIRHTDNHSEKDVGDGKQHHHWWWCGRATCAVAK